jgi:hypothetical protein
MSYGSRTYLAMAVSGLVLGTLLLLSTILFRGISATELPQQLRFTSEQSGPAKRDDKSREQKSEPGDFNFVDSAGIEPDGISWRRGLAFVCGQFAYGNRYRVAIKVMPTRTSSYAM